MSKGNFRLAFFTNRVIDTSDSNEMERPNLPEGSRPRGNLS
jgi:hypothetical protein